MDNISEKDVRVIRLLHLINQMKEAIIWHKAQENPSHNSIQNAIELKSRYEKELLELLVTELDMRIPVVA